jgi:hypothetical protein
LNLKWLVTNRVHDSCLSSLVIAHDVQDVELHHSWWVVLLNVDTVLILVVDTKELSHNTELSIKLCLVVG